MTNQDALKYTYCEINFPDRGLSLSGTIDVDSGCKIIDIAFAAKVDKSHTRPAPSSEALEALEWIETNKKSLITYCANFGEIKGCEVIKTIRAALERPSVDFEVINHALICAKYDLELYLAKEYQQCKAAQKNNAVKLEPIKPPALRAIAKAQDHLKKIGRT